jgi:hypothetical protein
MASSAVEAAQRQAPGPAACPPEGRAGVRGKTIQQYVTEALEEIISRHEEQEDRKGGRG